MRPDKKIMNNQGIALLLSVLMVSLILTMTLVIAAVFIPKVRTVAIAKNSVGAFFAAESIMEWCLFENFIQVPTSQPVMANGASYVLEIEPSGIQCGDAGISSIKAIGVYRNTTRASELTFAP